MIKFISYTTVFGALNVSAGEYCETKTLQSPHVVDVDDTPQRIDKLLPIIRCEVKQTRADKGAAILTCIENRKGWLKL